MDLDKAFYSFDQMRVFAEIGVALAIAQMAERPDAPDSVVRRDPAEPHETALSRAQEALVTLSASAAPPADLSDVTAAAVRDMRQRCLDAISRSEERLDATPALAELLRVDTAREYATIAAAQVWVDAIDAVHPPEES